MRGTRPLARLAKLTSGLSLNQQAACAMPLQTRRRRALNQRNKAVVPCEEHDRLVDLLAFANCSEVAFKLHLAREF